MIDDILLLYHNTRCSRHAFIFFKLESLNRILDSFYGIYFLFPIEEVNKHFQYLKH